MKNILKLFPLFAFTFFFIYSCNDTGPTIGNNSGSGGNHAPEIPKNPFPHNDTTGAPRLVTVSWTCEDPDEGDTVRFRIYMENNNPPTLQLVDSLTASSFFVPFLLDSNRVYYWRVIAKDNHGAVTSGSTWKFRTGSTD